MKKKFSAVLITGFLILGVTTPANAATAGGTCTTAGAKTTIAKNTYVCAKNPFYNTTKLTWVWDGCIEINADFQTGYKEGIQSLRDAEKARRDQLEPLGSSLQKLIAWEPLITYIKGSVVYYGSTYYSAVKTSNNKAPVASNLGSKKFWIVYNPTNLNPRIGQMPTPELVSSTVVKQIAALTNAAAKTSSVVTKMKINNLITDLGNRVSMFEPDKTQLQNVINVLDPLLVEAKSTLEIFKLTKEIVKDRCNPKY